MSAYVFLAETQDCPIGQSREVVAAGRVIALFNVEGTFYAFDGVCPHQGGPLGKGTLQGRIVTCPWHGWQFDVRSGECLLSPHIRQTMIPLKIEHDRIYGQLASRDPSSDEAEQRRPGS